MNLGMGCLNSSENVTCVTRVTCVTCDNDDNESDLGMGWLNSSENVTCVPVPRPLPGARGSGLKILSK